MFIVASAASFFATQLFVYTMVVWSSTAARPGLGALFYGLAFLPFLVASSAIGRWTDRADRLRVVCLAHLAITLLFVASLQASQSVTVLRVVGIGAAFGAVFIFIPSFRYALIADLYPRDRQAGVLVTLNIISVLSLSCSPLLHWLLSLVSAHAPIVASACLMTSASAVYVWLAQGRRAPSSPLIRASASLDDTPILPPGSPLRGAAVFCVLGIVIIGPLQSIVPGVLRDITHCDALRDMLMPAVGIGLITSSVLLKTVRSFDRQRVCLALAVLLILSAWLLASAREAWVAALALWLIGATAGTMVNWNQTVIQAATPPAAQGRLMALFAAMNMGVPALSSLLVGALTMRMPARHALLAVPVFLSFAVFGLLVKQYASTGLSRIEEIQ